MFAHLLFPGDCIRMTPRLTNLAALTSGTSLEEPGVRPPPGTSPIWTSMEEGTRLSWPRIWTRSMDALVSNWSTTSWKLTNSIWVCVFIAKFTNWHSKSWCANLYQCLEGVLSAWNQKSIPQNTDLDYKLSATDTDYGYFRGFSRVITFLGLLAALKESCLQATL